MTADEFKAWAADMVAQGRARPEHGRDIDLARLLGINKNTIGKYFREGTDRTVALACSALLMQLGPYPDVD